MQLMHASCEMGFFFRCVFSHTMLLLLLVLRVRHPASEELMRSKEQVLPPQEFPLPHWAYRRDPQNDCEDQTCHSRHASHRDDGPDDDAHEYELTFHRVHE